MIHLSRIASFTGRNATFAVSAQKAIVVNAGKTTITSAIAVSAGKTAITSAIAIAATVIMSSCCRNPKADPAIPVDKALEAKVETTLKGMSLDDKIGQMCEITIEAVTDQDASEKEGKVVLSEAMLDTVLNQCRVGSILNVPLGKAQTKESWSEVIKTIQDRSIAANGIPDVYGVDQIHGASYTDGATFFPQEICQAASFDRTIPFRVSEITAYESRACSIPWVYSPVMDLGRNPAWSRQWESYGEDCFVNAAMAQQAVRGYQGDDPNKIGPNNVGVCIKHYMAYGVPVSGKDRTPSLVTEREMREKYFKPFLESIRAGAVSLMVNSAVNDGVPFHCNVKYLTQWLKEELNWDGMIVTDWADINNLWSRDHVAADKKEAIKLAINAGIDMSMDPYNLDFCVLLKELVQEGEVSMDRINDATRRVLRLKYRLGLFDTPVTLPSEYPDFASVKFAKEAQKMAEDGEILLKNDGVLPLKQGTRILVTGPNANSMRCLNGGWSYTWQGQMTDTFAAKYNTIFEALSAKFGSENVILEQGIEYVDDGNAFTKEAWARELEPDIQKAVAAARRADVIVACIGENSYCETPGNLSDLTLSQNQRDLVKALAKTGKPVILVLNEGRPRIIRDIEPLAKGIIDVMLPGNYGGDALANLLSGDANFSAKLPFTYPSHPQSISTYDYKPCEFVSTMSGAYNYNATLDVQWPFGFGLSYTTFAYSNLKVNKSSFTADDELVFSVDVTNAGSVAGKEAVLLYSSDKVASISPDNIRLRQFDKVALEPGETKTVTLTIKASDLAFVGADCKWVLEAGDFHIKCADQSLDINCSQTHRWETPNI